VNHRQIILDTETTGLSHAQGHRIIEIGCVELINRRLTGNHFQVYLNPGRSVDEGAFRVHGISTEFLKDKPKFIDILPQFLEYLNGAELVIHNASFDVGFINAEFVLARAKIKDLEAYCSVIDTLAMARAKHPGQRNNLDALCRRYQVNFEHRKLHGALLDAEILAEVYLAMTGGQVSLSFETKTVEKQSSKIETILKTEQSYKTPLVLANEQEREAHQKYIQALKNAVAWDE
jgi:DNA polymerase-3 subunit epsilon